MTKYKQNLISLRSGIDQLKKIRSFDDYLAFDNTEQQDQFDQEPPNFGLTHRDMKLNSDIVENGQAGRHLQTINHGDDLPMTPLILSKSFKRKTVTANIWSS